MGWQFISILCFPLKRNPSLKLIKLETRIPYTLIWYHGIRDITRGGKLLVLFPPNFCQGNRSQNRKKNFMTFFLKQIVYLHLKDSCLSSKKRIKGPGMSKVWENRQCYVLGLLRLHPHSLCPSTHLNWPAPLHAYAEKHIGFSASLGFLFQRFPCHIEFIFTKLLCFFLCYAVKFLLKGLFY